MFKKNISEINISLRDILIMILLILCLWLYLNPLNKSNIDFLKEKNKDLDKQVQQIETERDSLKKQRIDTYKKIDSLTNVTNSRSDSIKKLKSLSYNQRLEIKEQNEKIKLFDEMLEESERQIEKLRKNPIILPKNKIIEKMKEKL
jgi:chromosome segregation ATPase